MIRSSRLPYQLPQSLALASTCCALPLPVQVPYSVPTGGHGLALRWCCVLHGRLPPACTTLQSPLSTNSDRWPVQWGTDDGRAAPFGIWNPHPIWAVLYMYSQLGADRVGAKHGNMHRDHTIWLRGQQSGRLLVEQPNRRQLRLCRQHVWGKHRAPCREVLLFAG